MSMLLECLTEMYVTEYFDDLFVGIMTGGNGAFRIVGYDSYEEDYFRLTSRYEDNLAVQEAKKRLMRLTKDEIINVTGECFGVAMSYFNIQYKYKCLQSAFDILNNDNASLIKQVKEIENAYNELQRDIHDYDKQYHFDKLTAYLPEKLWVE